MESDQPDTSVRDLGDESLDNEPESRVSLWARDFRTFAVRNLYWYNPGLLYTRWGQRIYCILMSWIILRMFEADPMCVHSKWVPMHSKGARVYWHSFWMYAHSTSIVVTRNRRVLNMCISGQNSQYTWKFDECMAQMFRLTHSLTTIDAYNWNSWDKGGIIPYYTVLYQMVLCSTTLRW
jgi:hypothetical protein